jgi:hypothetical protein
METAASSDPEELQTTSARKNGLLLIEAGHLRLLPRACRFDAYPVPCSRVDDRRKAR